MCSYIYGMCLQCNPLHRGTISHESRMELEVPFIKAEVDALFNCMCTYRFNLIHIYKHYFNLH